MVLLYHSADCWNFSGLEILEGEIKAELILAQRANVIFVIDRTAVGQDFPKGIPLGEPRSTASEEQRSDRY